MAATMTHGSPTGLAGTTQWPVVPTLTPAGFVLGPPNTAKSPPVPLGPACERFTVPTLTAVALLELTWIERFGPPRMLIAAVPPTDTAALAVWCNTSSGMGSATGFRPQLAFADMLNVLLEDTNFVKESETGYVIETWTYG